MMADSPLDYEELVREAKQARCIGSEQFFSKSRSSRQEARKIS